MCVLTVTSNMEDVGSEVCVPTLKRWTAQSATLQGVRLYNWKMSRLHPSIVLVPALMVFIPNAFRFLVGKFDAEELAMDLHVGGIALMTPLPFWRQDMAEVLTYTIVLSTMTLLLTAACYMNVQLNPRRLLYQKIGLGIGLSFFIFGAALIVIL